MIYTYNYKYTYTHISYTGTWRFGYHIQIIYHIYHISYISYTHILHIYSIYTYIWVNYNISIYFTHLNSAATTGDDSPGLSRPSDRRCTPGRRWTRSHPWPNIFFFGGPFFAKKVRGGCDHSYHGNENCGGCDQLAIWLYHVKNV